MDVRGIINPREEGYQREVIFTLLPVFRGVVFEEFREHDGKTYEFLESIPTCWGVSAADGDVTYPLFRIRLSTGEIIEASHEELVWKVDGEEIQVGIGTKVFGNRFVAGKWVN